MTPSFVFHAVFWLLSQNLHLHIWVLVVWKVFPVPRVASVIFLALWDAFLNHPSEPERASRHAALTGLGGDAVRVSREHAEVPSTGQIGQWHSAQESSWDARMEPGSAVCKANATPPQLLPQVSTWIFRTAGAPQLPKECFEFPLTTRARCLRHCFRGSTLGLPYSKSVLV